MSSFLKDSFGSEFSVSSYNDVLHHVLPSYELTGREHLSIDQEMNKLNGRDKDSVTPRPMDLWATWWLFAEPKMDEVYEKSGDYLDKWMNEREISSVYVSDTQRIFEARFEWRNFDRSFMHSDGVVEKQTKDNVPIFIDFLSGLGWDAIELITSIREASMKKEHFEIIKAKDLSAAPMPDTLFGGYDPKVIYWNYLWLPTKDTEKYFEAHAGTLKGTDKPKNIHDWMRLNILMADKFPVPGEFMGIAIRIFSEWPWGSQKSNPFIYSGNFMDTAYNVRGRITEVIDPTDNQPFKMYKVKTHLNKGKEITICATDFEDYNVDDYVTICKDVSKIENKDVFNWEDMAKTEVDESTWMILATTYYDLDEVK